MIPLIESENGLTMAKHKTIPISHNEWVANVDELIAPLILTLWKNSIRTIACCQEEIYLDRGRKMAYILFGNKESGLRFLSLIMDSLSVDKNIILNWRIEISHHNSLIVRFPSDDIKIINKII